MWIKLKNKKDIMKKLSIIVLMVLFCAVLYSIPNNTLGQEIKSKKLLTNDPNSNGIDINSIELKSSLSKLTNTQKLENLKSEMKGLLGKEPSEKELNQEAIKRGIIVQQGLLVDIDKLKELKQRMSIAGLKDEDIIDKAKQDKIIKELGNTKITDINIDDLIALKNNMEGKSDEDIVRQAIKKEIIKGLFSDVNLEIDTNLDFRQVDLKQFGNYDANDYLNLSDLKGNEDLYKKSLSDLNIAGGKIKTEYDIALKNNPISESDNSEAPMDVAIIVDTAADKNSYLANGLNNKIFTNAAFVNNLPNDTNFMVIPYHIDKERQDYLYYYNKISNHNNYKDDLQQMIVKLKDDGAKKIDMTDTINRALKDAESWFGNKDKARLDSGNTKQSSKTILLLTGEIDNNEYGKCFKTDETSGMKKFILKNDYNTISIFHSGYGYGDELSKLSEPYNSNIKNLHSKIGGVDSTFYVSYTEKPGQETHNDINSIEHAVDNICIAEKVAKDLLNSQYNRYVNTIGMLHFNLGKNINISQEELDKDKLKPLEDQIFNVSTNENGEQICQMKVPKISLKTDYSILSDTNLGISEIFIDDFIGNIIENTNQIGIKNDEVKLYLKDRLKDLNITIEDSDVQKITKGIYEQKLSPKIQNLSLDYVSKIKTTISSGTNNQIKNTYDDIKDITVIDILKNNNNNYPVEKYGKLTEILMDILREDMQDRINNSLSETICTKYDIKKADKDFLIDGILNGTSAEDSVKSKIAEITKKNSAEVIKILTKIKGLFNTSTKVSSLKLSNESVQILTVRQYYDKTIKEVLDIAVDSDIDIKSVKEEIRFLLRQMLNKPLGLTKTTFSVSGEGESVGFTIEPTVKAALDESKEKLEFVYNLNDLKNNYLQYSSSVNGNGTVTKETLVNSTPILNIKRILVEKSHLVYGKLGNIITKDERDITGAIEVEHNGSLAFADNSMVTFASNITGLSGRKNISLTIDSKCESLNKAGVEDMVGQKPRIYNINYHDINNSNDDELEWVCDMIETSKDTSGNTEAEKSKNVYLAENFNCDIYKDIIILYSVKLNGKGTYINNVKVSGLSGGTGDVKIAVNDNLPDLF